MSQQNSYEPQNSYKSDTNRTLKLGDEYFFIIPEQLFDDLDKIAKERRAENGIFTVILQAIATEVHLWKTLKNPNVRLLLENTSNNTIKELKFTD